MKRVKNSDIKFKINKKLVYLPNFVIRFYTVNQKEYFFEKTQDDLVSYEREATVDDVEVILSGGTTVTEYYLPLNWSELLFVGQGILNYKLTNNIEDPEFPDYQYNKEEVVTTDFYIDSIKVDPEPDESLIERVIQLEEHLDEEIVNREEADAAISGAVDSEIARAVSAETALQEAIDDEIERAISAETLIVDALEEEANRAISAETALDAKIDQEIADRIADVNAEEARAINAESALTDTINAEANRAISAETALDAKIDAETNRATSAETVLQTAINDEATARANADTELQTAITNEESRAREAESAITNALNAEVTRATGAENALDTKIDAETTRATGAEAALDVKIDTVSGNVISETTRATTAENALSGAIDSISAATSGSVEELDAKIDQEITDRTADVDAEETRAKGVENALSGAIDTIDAKFIDDAKYENSGNTKVINFYNGNTVKATIDCTDFLVDGMIDNVYIENGYLVIDFNTASGKQDIRIPLTDIFNPANYYTKDETSGATEIANALALKLNISDFNTYSGAVDTLINSKASQSTVDALNGVVTAHTADTSIHLTSGDVQTQIDNSISGKVNVSDNVVSAYSFDKSTKIKYPDITAERIPSIPSGTKKISIGFTMLPANNQLFETLQFVTFNPFGFADVASGLTVGVSEDMSTIPFTYTVTSVTWTGDDSVMSYDISENDTLLNLYAQGDYIFNSVVPKGINVLTMYIDVLEDIESGQTAEVVNDGIIKNFENVGKYLQDERNRVDNKIDNKLDATAYTPVVSSIMQGSTNPVEGGTLWDELRVQTSPGQGETTITFDSNNYSTNYPLGCTSLKVNVGAVDEFVSIYFYNSSNTNLGEISVANFGGIEVTNNTLPGATYEISGNIVTLSYPAQGIVKIEKMYSENFSFSAVNPPVYDTLKNVVDAKQDQLVSSVNIKTINNESILGAGNIDIQGGGKAIEAGRGIDITTGETADTVSFNLPISAGTGQDSIIIGDGRNISSERNSVAEGFLTSATTQYAHSEGSRTLASGSYSCHAEGSRTSATSEASHSEGSGTTASGQYSHSEGLGTLASGRQSHSEGKQTSATTTGAHSEGSGTLASGEGSHSEGKQTSATSMYSHSEGWGTIASGKISHSEGSGTTASGEGSHTEGKGTIALNKYEHSEGYFNVSSSGSSTFGDSGNTLFSVGNGTADDARHNAFEIRQNGDIYLTKDGQDVKLQDQLGGGGGGITSGEVQTMITSATTPIYQTIEDNEEVTAEALNVLNAALSGKADSSDVYLKSETSGATEISTALATKQPKLSAGTGISIDANNVISVTGGTGGGISSAECQTMIDESISGKTNQSDFTGHTADTTIHVTAQDKTNWNNKSDFSGDYNDLTNKPTIPTVPTNVSDFTNDAGYITSNDISGKTNQSDFTAHTANTTVHVTSAEKATWNNKSDFSGNYNDLSNKPTIPSKTSDLTNDSNFATTGDVQTATNDMATKTWVGQQGYLTEHQDISGKQDVSGMTAYTQNSTFNAYTAATNSALANKQNQLTPGTGISIQNDVISVTASSPSVDAYTKAESDAKFATITNFNSHTGNTTHITSSERVYWNNKSDFSGSYNDLTDKPTIPNYTAGSGITISNNVISAKIWSGTQAQYDALAVKDNDTIYLIYNS